MVSPAETASYSVCSIYTKLIVALAAGFYRQSVQAFIELSQRVITCKKLWEMSVGIQAREDPADSRQLVC